MKLTLNADEINIAIRNELERRGYNVSSVRVCYYGDKKPYVEADVTSP